ncbi:MAG: hypothetical protein IKX88_12860, partial [Thermoguttaceae bacterium]|nr:hypothetical protein [Thermoguttaceae bacterium]
MFSLTGYDGSNGDAALVRVKNGKQTTVLDANGDDATNSLITSGVLVGATHDAFVLTHYDNSDGDAAKIFVQPRAEVAVFDEDSNETDYLIANSILTSYCVGHGWVDALTNAKAVDVQTANASAVEAATIAFAVEATETLVLMSEVKNAGETPIFFARIEDSATGVPFTQSHVSSVTYTVYKYSQDSIRNGANGKTPVSADWTDVSVNVEDCFLNTPV